MNFKNKLMDGNNNIFFSVLNNILKFSNRIFYFFTYQPVSNLDISISKKINFCQVDIAFCEKKFTKNLKN